MIPGEMLIKEGEIELNAGRKTVTLSVTNRGDRPITRIHHDRWDDELIPAHVRFGRMLVVIRNRRFG